MARAKLSSVFQKMDKDDPKASISKSFGLLEGGGAKGSRNTAPALLPKYVTRASHPVQIMPFLLEELGAMTRLPPRRAPCRMRQALAPAVEPSRGRRSASRLM